MGGNDDSINRTLPRFPVDQMRDIIHFNVGIYCESMIL